MSAMETWTSRICCRRCEIAPGASSGGGGGGGECEQTAPSSGGPSGGGIMRTCVSGSRLSEKERNSLRDLRS